MNKNNEDLISILKDKHVLKSKRIEEAFRNVPRDKFIKHKDVFEDVPLPTVSGQTISQPSVVARMTEWLAPQSGDKILEVGSGSGWQTAILAWLVAPTGKIYTVERISTLVEMARKNLQDKGCKNVVIISGDGSVGNENNAPYNGIICTAAAPKIPDAWVFQLKEKGRVVAPVGEKMAQTMILAQKQKGNLKILEKEKFYRFVPLYGQEGF